MYYLYLKTHNKTGLKYLGKTEQKDPHLYSGSGKYWKLHLRKHGYDYTTQILLATEDKSELKETGLFFSRLWDIAQSNEWANLQEEKGDGGDTSKFFTPESIEKIILSNKGPVSQETRKKISQLSSLNNLGRIHSIETKEKQRIANIGRDYGKWWITDGINSKMIYRNEPIPIGWRRGRKM